MASLLADLGTALSATVKIGSVVPGVAPVAGAATDMSTDGELAGACVDPQVAA